MAAYHAGFDNGIHIDDVERVTSLRRDIDEVFICFANDLWFTACIGRLARVAEFLRNDPTPVVRLPLTIELDDEYFTVSSRQACHLHVRLMRLSFPLQMSQDPKRSGSPRNKGKGQAKWKEKPIHRPK